MNATVALAASIIATSAWIQVRKHLRMRRYWQRPCSGALWRRRFPDASKDEIRNFLDLIVNAFGFSRSRRLKFSPHDEIMAIYRAVYPRPGWRGDALELEWLVMTVEGSYGVEVMPVWREDITIGELFLHATRQENQ